MEFRQKSELLWPHYLHDLAPVIFPTSFSLLSIHCQSLSALACFQFLQYQAEVCLRVPRRLSLASYLAHSLSPFTPFHCSDLSSRVLTQAFPDHMSEVTFILNTSNFFIFSIALLTK